MLERDASNAEARQQLDTVANRIGFIGYILIGKRHVGEALNVLDQVIDLVPAEIGWHGYRAYAFMLIGEVHRARALFLEHRGKGTWDEDILAIIKEVRSIGHAHPLMDEIETLFTSPVCKE